MTIYTRLGCGSYRTQGRVAVAVHDEVHAVPVRRLLHHRPVIGMRVVVVHGVGGPQRAAIGMIDRIRRGLMCMESSMYLQARGAPQEVVVLGRGHADDPPSLPDLGGELRGEVADTACVGIG